MARQAFLNLRPLSLFAKTYGYESDAVKRAVKGCPTGRNGVSTGKSSLTKIGFEGRKGKIRPRHDKGVAEAEEGFQARSEVGV